MENPAAVGTGSRDLPVRGTAFISVDALSHLSRGVGRMVRGGCKGW